LRYHPEPTSHQPQSRRRATNVLAWLLGLTWLASLSARANEPVFAWLEDDTQQKLIQISRSGRIAPYDREAGFRACDEVSLAPAAPTVVAPVAISTADGSRYILDRGSGPIKIPCSPAVGLAHDTATFLRALIQKSNMRLPMMAATRGQASCSGPNDVVVPLLSTQADIPTLLVSDRRSLVLTWVGSAAPFQIELDSPEGTPVTHVVSFDGHILRTPPTTLPVGRYRLRLLDSCGAGVEDDDVEVVAAIQRPKLPKELQQLPEPQKTIFYADYLIALDDGRWGLEALQLVGALPRSDSAAQAWIARWAGGQPQ
jgi:hypothetical protein